MKTDSGFRRVRDAGLEQFGYICNGPKHLLEVSDLNLFFWCLFLCIKSSFLKIEFHGNSD